MNVQLRLIAVVSALLPSLVGCGGAKSADEDETEGALEGSSAPAFADYSSVSATVASGEIARQLAERLQRAGAKRVPGRIVYAGLSEKEVGVSDSATDVFGLSCTAPGGPVSSMECTFNAIVRSATILPRGRMELTVTIEAKQAAAIVASVPKAVKAGALELGELRCASESGTPVCTMAVGGQRPQPVGALVHESSKAYWEQLFAALF